MDTKDYISLSLSSLAFVLSLSATAISLHQKKYETERTLRSQLTDAIGKLNAAFEAVEKLRSENTDDWNTSRIVNFRSFYNGQKLFYARQALYVAEQIPNLVTDVEYNSIARTFGDLDDDDSASKYYELAIAATNSPIFKASNLRGYGRLLIRMGKLEQGRKRFSEALAAVSGESDSAHWFRAETLGRWAQIELDIQSADFNGLFTRAKAEYELIKFPPRKAEGLANLELIWHPQANTYAKDKF